MGWPNWSHKLELLDVLPFDSEQAEDTDLLLRMGEMHNREMLPSLGRRHLCALLMDLASNSHIGLVGM